MECLLISAFLSMTLGPIERYVRLAILYTTLFTFLGIFNPRARGSQQRRKKGFCIMAMNIKDRRKGGWYYPYRAAVSKAYSTVQSLRWRDREGFFAARISLLSLSFPGFFNEGSSEKERERDS